MRVLVIGGGGREHALAWKLSHSPSVKEVLIAPGNPGAAQVATRYPANDVESWLALAQEKAVDLTVVGPEAPLVAGVVDRFRTAGLAIVGPSAAAAQLEGSKAFSKDFMIRAGVATARYRVVTSMEEAHAALDEFGSPVVLKADGLAAGKGVVVADDRAEAEAALPELLGSASRLVIEEFLSGDEVSFIVLSDGKQAVRFAPTRDHKRIFDDDKGPNTGGMGAYRADEILSATEIAAVERTVIQPVLTHMTAEGRSFTGFLYAGLMMTTSGPRVLEFNVRMGDPETQPLMHGLKSDLAQMLLAAAQGDLGGVPALEWDSPASVCVVMAAAGYPGKVRTGDTIHGLAEAESYGATVFQAGTSQAPDGALKTAGGRVLGVTTSGLDLPAAIDRAYVVVEAIQFDGMQFRSDIGSRGLRRY